MGKRLLVVDSDRRFIQDHKSPLESAFEVDFLYATDGALTRLESGQYAGVLLCVETSENKGYALCAAIRRTLGDLKIALISSKASEEEYNRHRGTKGKADLYLHKPITTSALIPALAEIVPLREDDPDNPLGDLAGSDLGDEWLESLRAELEPDLSPAPFAPLPIAPAPVWAAAPERPAPSAGDLELLEWRVKDLELKLVARTDELERKNREIQDLLLSNAAVTRNLDEAQQAQAAAAVLGRKLQEQDAKTGLLETELRDAQDERKRLADLLKDMNAQLQEKAQANADLLETHQLLQAQLDEAWETGGRVPALEASLADALDLIQGHETQAGLTAAEREEHLAGLQEALARIQDLEAVQERTAGAERERDDLGRELAEARNRIQDLEAVQERAAGAERERDDLGRELAEARGRIRDLEALAARAAETMRERDVLRTEMVEKDAWIQELETSQSHVTDLERELASAQDQVSFQELALRKMADERNTLQASLDRQEEAFSEQAGVTMELRDKLNLATSTVQSLEKERAGFESTLQGLAQQLERADYAHENQQRELLAGIDEREMQLGRLNATLDAQRERIDQLEQEKEGMATLALGHRERIQVITSMLADLEGKAREALDLAKAVTD